MNSWVRGRGDGGEGERESERGGVRHQARCQGQGTGRDSLPKMPLGLGSLKDPPGPLGGHPQLGSRWRMSKPNSGKWRKDGRGSKSKLLLLCREDGGDGSG